MWEQRFPTMMANTIAACRRHDSKLVFFDNTYMPAHIFACSKFASQFSDFPITSCQEGISQLLGPSAATKAAASP